MINFETYHEVRRLSRELNLTPAQIAAKSGLNIKTIRKWLDKPRYEPRSKGAKRTSKLDPYKDLIVSWLEKHPYTGMQIFQRLRSEHGYTGGRSILQDFIVTVRPVRHQAFLKLAFEAGDCMQIDWATHGLMRIGECLRKLHYFAAVLCYSRLLYVEFFLSQSMECFLAANRHALEYYGASPRRAMHDNLKTAVLERLPGYAPVFNPRYLDFAAHYGFKPVACNVGKATKKGGSRTRSGTFKKTFSMVCKSVRWKHSMPKCAAGWSRSLTSESIAKRANDPATPSKRKSQPFNPCRSAAMISVAAVGCVRRTVAGSPSNPTVTPYPSNTPEPCWNCSSRPRRSPFSEVKN
jgi:transposase